jgi:methionyl-tRNA formyltransferase
VNIVLVAEEAAGVQTLRAIAGTAHRISAVLSSPPSACRGARVADVARHLGVDVWPPELVRTPELAQMLRERQVDLLLNVHSLHVIHPDVLRAARIGSFNLHPGPLPQYAGLHAPSWAVFNGEPSHGVTVHWMSARIDGGAIAYQATFGLGEDDTGLSVSAQCVRLGVALLRQLVATAAADPGAIPVREQDAGLRRYHGREVPNGAVIDWSRSASEVTRFVRACDYGPLASPWGPPRTRLRDQAICIIAASRTRQRCAPSPGTIGRLSDGSPVVATADEWVRIDRLCVDGRTVDARAVLASGQRLDTGC